MTNFINIQKQKQLFAAALLDLIFVGNSQGVYFQKRSATTN